MARSRPDSLETYRKKRNFAVTPEPAGVKPAKAGGAAARTTFMVHKHDATRLHYDIRLEIGGALASWAVPQGPSDVPDQKRLAVQTGDHPLADGGFEGRIPDGEYGGGDSIIWDRGTYRTVPPGEATRQREKGHLEIEFDGEKLKGRWHLVRTRPARGKEQWLIFKAKDGQERRDYDVVAERPESVLSGRRATRGPVRKKTLRAQHPAPEVLLAKVWPPMLATLSDGSQVPPGTHSLEVKYDGFRALCAMSGGKVCLLSRNRLDLAPRFPQLARELTKLAATMGEAVIDAEIVTFDSKGVSRFQELSVEGVRRHLVAFDLLWLEGDDLRGRPLEERRDLLQSLLSRPPPSVQLSRKVKGEVEEALGEAGKSGWEGLIAKQIGSPYQGGRTQQWLKLKTQQGQEVAIVGFKPISNGKPAIGALLLGLYEDGGYRYAGKVGTGFTERLRRELFERLTSLEVKEPSVLGAPRERGARWVRPKLVGQVTFTEWTRDGSLRHPAFQGLRDDKKPEECMRERPALPASKPARVKGNRRAPQVPRARVEVELTHPDRVLFPESKLTKRDIFDYYRAVAEAMVPILRDRPLTLQQWPQGIDQQGFFRQDVTHAPEWLTREPIEHEQRVVKHVVVDRPEAVLWLANQSALTLHMMASRTSHRAEPDWVVFDLDPVDRGFEAMIEVAQALRGLLKELGLTGLPKTSGKRGLHVLVPLAPGHTHQQAAHFAVAVTETLAKAFPKTATTLRTKSKRGNRMYLDAFQNGEGKTVVAPYSVRAVEGGQVSTPLDWEEVTEKLDLTAFTVKTVPIRLGKRRKQRELFAQMLLSGNQRLPQLSKLK